MKSNKINFIDMNLTQLHELLYEKYRFHSVILSTLAYILIVMLFGNHLGISSNYFVILPVVSFSFAFGFWGGILSGSLALPCNLLLFYLLGHLEYSPESKLIAQISGVLIGISLGYTSDYFKKMKKEILKRIRSEVQLKKSLEDKEVLLHEIHHRVKNNLNLIKSLIQLQILNDDDEEKREELEKLNRRILAIALVQDQLYSPQFQKIPDLRDYVRHLIEHLTKGLVDSNIEIEINHTDESLPIHSKTLTPLGLIINELITNSVKHGFDQGQKGKIIVRLSREEKLYYLEVEDNGKGMNVDVVKEQSQLGLNLIHQLAKQLRGTLQISSSNGSRFSLTFPAAFPS